MSMWNRCVKERSISSRLTALLLGVRIFVKAKASCDTGGRSAGLGGVKPLGSCTCKHARVGHYLHVIIVHAPVGAEQFVFVLDRFM
jgi:hypothetical protein